MEATTTDSRKVDVAPEFIVHGKLDMGVSKMDGIAFRMRLSNKEVETLDMAKVELCKVGRRSGDESKSVDELNTEINTKLLALKELAFSILTKPE